MLVAKYRSYRRPGNSAYISANVAKEHEQDGEFRCPSCNEIVYPSAGTGNPGEKYYRGPYFRHQSSALCLTADCDLRVDASSGMSIPQRLRVPLFIRPVGNGEFKLSAGFASADKELLRRLRGRHKEVSIKCPSLAKNVKVSLDDMIESGELTLVDLPAPVAKNSAWEVSLVTNDGGSSSLHANNVKEWSDRLDWFGDSSLGAVFEYSAGNAGEKVRFGGYIKSGRPYIVAEKLISGFPTTLKKFSQQGILPYERLGTLRFKDNRTYEVAKVVFPRRSDGDGSAAWSSNYENMIRQLDDRFGVSLTDTMQETLPLWPPTSRRSDAHIVSKMMYEGNRLYALVSGMSGSEKVFVHNSNNKAENAMEVQRFWDGERDEDCEECNESAVVLIPLTMAKSYVTVNEMLPNGMDSFRYGTLKNDLTPCLGVQQPDSEEAQCSGYGTMNVSKGTAIRGVSSGCTVYRKGKEPVKLKAGEPFMVESSREEFFVVLNTGDTFHFNPKAKSRADVQPIDAFDYWSKDKYGKTDKYSKYGKYAC